MTIEEFRIMTGKDKTERWKGTRLPHGEFPEQQHEERRCVEEW